MRLWEDSAAAAAAAGAQLAPLPLLPVPQFTPCSPNSRATWRGSCGGVPPVNPCASSSGCVRGRDSRSSGHALDPASSCERDSLRGREDAEDNDFVDLGGLVLRWDEPTAFIPRQHPDSAVPGDRAAEEGRDIRIFSGLEQSQRLTSSTTGKQHRSLPLGGPSSTLGKMPGTGHGEVRTTGCQLGSRSATDHESFADARLAELRSAREEVELRILMERLQLLKSQRELAALRCERFARMLDKFLAQQAGEHSGAVGAGNLPKCRPCCHHQHRRNMSLGEGEQRRVRRSRHKRQHSMGTVEGLRDNLT